MSFPNYEALHFESQPMVPGSATRLMLLRRGAGVERERIVALLVKHGRSLTFGDDKTLLSNVIKLIESDPE